MATPAEVAPRQKGQFVHPEMRSHRLFDWAATTYNNPELRTLSKGTYGPAIKTIANDLVTHPAVVFKEMKLAEADNPLKAQEITERHTSQYAYVSDIHGLDDAQFAKLRESLAQGNFDKVFFIGDIGGSEALSKFQRLFYQGEDNLTGKRGFNRYKELQKEGADDSRLLTELGEGYRNMFTYAKVLESHSHMSDEEARKFADELSDEQVLDGIKWVMKHKHYGHFISDTKGGFVTDHVIMSLAADVESYYERFAQMVAELQLNSKTRVHVLQGNWDPRLPFDFEAGTEDPVPLDSSKRRFNDIAFFQKMGIDYHTNVGAIETDDSIHVLVPFDSVAKGIDENGAILTTEKISQTREQVEKAKKEGKNVIMVAHAVPSWKMHRKPSTGEGQTTEKNLLTLIGELQPHQIIYGHEHVIRHDENGQLLDLDTRYRILTEGEEVTVNQVDETLAELSKRSDGVVAVHHPIPKEPFLGIASVEIPKGKMDKRSRGNGGLGSPIRIGRGVVAWKDLTTQLPTEKILSPVLLQT